MPCKDGRIALVTKVGHVCAEGEGEGEGGDNYLSKPEVDERLQQEPCSERADEGDVVLRGQRRLGVALDRVEYVEREEQVARVAAVQADVCLCGDGGDVGKWLYEVSGVRGG